jgi:hypothetical protein
LELLLGLLGVESVDENGAGEPKRQTKGPKVEELLFGHRRAPLHFVPNPKHAQNVQGALVVGHGHARLLLTQNFRTSHFPFDSKKMRNQTQHLGRPTLQINIIWDGKNGLFFLEKKSTFFSLFLSKFFFSRFLSEKVAF